MEGILGVDRLPGSANMQNLALIGLNSMSQVRSHSCKLTKFSLRNSSNTEGRVDLGSIEVRNNQGSN